VVVFVCCACFLLLSFSIGVAVYPYSAGCIIGASLNKFDRICVAHFTVSLYMKVVAFFDEYMYNDDNMQRKDIRKLTF